MTAQTLKDTKERLQVVPEIIPENTQTISEPNNGTVLENVRDAEIEAQAKLQESLGNEARLREEAKIPDEISHLVKSPQDEARQVITHGTTMELPITEEKFNQGEKEKVGGFSINLEVVGVKSLVGFVMYVGKFIKKSHHNMKKIVFRGSGNNSQTLEKEEGNAN